MPVKAASDEALLAEAARSFVSEDPAPEVIGVMVSGGGDSVALLHLMQRAGMLRGWQVEAVTVDHGLRAAAVAEAAQVAALCADLGVAHHICHWDGPKDSGNLMDQARRARFDLVAAWAAARGIGHVVMGHTADDQAETFLMGLARSSGIDGLSGMRAVWRDRSVVWARPLLTVARQDLRDYLRRRGIGWVEDPTNDDASYARVRARRAMAVLGGLGITAPGLTAVAGHLDMARSALRLQAAAAARAVDTRAGMVRMARQDLWAQPEEVQRRLLIAALRWISGTEYPPREAALERVQAAILTGKDTTLGGCRFRLQGPDLVISREARAMGGICAPDQVWDGRWRVQGPIIAGLTVGALGAAGLAACKDWRDTGLPREVLAVTPALWQDGQLVAAPLVRQSGVWSASLGQSLYDFILSH